MLSYEWIQKFDEHTPKERQGKCKSQGECSLNFHVGIYKVIDAQIEA